MQQFVCLTLFFHHSCWPGSTQQGLASPPHLVYLLQGLFQQIRLQTCLLYYRCFTIKAPCHQSFISFYSEAASQEMCFQQQQLNTTPEPADGEQNRSDQQERKFSESSSHVVFEIRDDQNKTHRVGLHLHQVVQDPSDRKVLEEEQKQNITVMSSDSSSSIKVSNNCWKEHTHTHSYLQ